MYKKLKQNQIIECMVFVLNSTTNLFPIVTLDYNVIGLCTIHRIVPNHKGYCYFILYRMVTMINYFVIIQCNALYFFGLLIILKSLEKSDVKIVDNKVM